MAKRKKSERLPHIDVKVPMPSVKPAKAEVTVETHIVEPAKKSDELDGTRPPKGDTSTSW